MLLFGALALAALLLGWLILFGPGPSQRPTTVVVQSGGGVRGVGRALLRAHVIRSAALFDAAAEATGAGRRLQAGEYAFPAHVSISKILSIIESGKVVRHSVTIPEGYTSAAALAVLKATEALSGSAVLPPEGALLPETYEITRGESRAAVIDRMRSARDALLARLWASRPSGLPYKTPQDAVILASVVEKETALASERPRVAAVFINRLRQGMRLGSDPTVIYGLTGGTPLGHGLTVSELASASPYNTYHVAGLPPGPIDNPGRASLAAALQPAHTSDLYFVADGTGGHAFAATLADHNRNVAHWRQIEHAAKKGG